MTTVISSHVKDKNRIFTGYEMLVTGKILVFHRRLYNKSRLLTEIILKLSVLLPHRRSITASTQTT